jgi:PKD repeat protein
MKIFRILSVVAVIATTHMVYGQGNPCGTDLINLKYGFEHPERMDYRSQIQELISNSSPENASQRNTIVVPTVVHVMHVGGDENVSTRQVQDAMRILNEDLRRQNSDTANTRPIFKEFGADFNVEFRLAKLDPGGNCTNGITHTYSPITYSANDAIKETSSGGIDPWPVNKYFNIWVVGGIVLDESGVIGYAYFPSWGMSNNYGVVIDHKYFGTIGSAIGKDGRTLTHEVGHCLELYHTFQSGCGSNCSSSGDAVCDTPPTASATFGCSYGLNSCANDNVGPSPYGTNVPDMVENYMSYNQNFCQNIFTKGQKQRSDNVFSNTFVSQLVTPQNLLATGTADGFTAAPCTLVPDFKVSDRSVCVGDSVSLTDFTLNGDPALYQWTITGPQTITSTLANPKIGFSQAGLYSVSLSVTNASGLQTVSKQNMIRVNNTTGSLEWIFVDGFDNHPIETGRWQPNNSPFSNGWNENTVSGNSVLYINNYNNDLNNHIHEIYSPVYDLSNLVDPKFRFKTAHANKLGLGADKLKLYFSTNCGETWSLKFIKTTTMLVSMSSNNQAIIPAASSDWLDWEVDVPDGMEGMEGFMAKFVFETGGGNDFYLDDINIIGIAAINESIQTGTLNIYPNPVSDYFMLDLTSLHEKSLTLSIYDMSGRIIVSKQVNGETEVSLSASSLGLAAGMYRISVGGKSNMMSGKIIVTQ